MIPKLNFVNKLLISKLSMSNKTDESLPCPRCLSLPFQPMYSQYSRQEIVCAFCVSHRNSTTSLHVEMFHPRMASAWLRACTDVHLCRCSPIQKSTTTARPWDVSLSPNFGLSQKVILMRLGIRMTRGEGLL